MTSIPKLEGQPAGHETRDDLWLICPICKGPNPAGTLHCKFCWGASLYAVTPITGAQLAEFTEKRDKRVRRFRLVRTLALGIGAPVLLLTAAFLWVYSFTDLVFAPPAHLTSAPVQGDWSMFRHDLVRTGATDIAPVNPKGELKWSFETEGEIHSSPTVVNSVVYFGSRDGKLYALDAETGAKKWTFQAESWIESSPTVVNGVVYVGSNDGKFYSLDAASGRKLWEFETLYAVKSSPAVAGNTVYFGADDYFVYALDARTGKEIWRFETDGHVMSSPVVSGGILYVGSMDMSCYALDAESGRFRLKMNTMEVFGSPAVIGETVYFTSRNFLFAMDGLARNWPGEHDLRPWWLQFYAFRLAPPPPPRSGVLGALRLGFFASNTTPVIDGTTLYTTGDNKLLAVDLPTRKFKWSFPTLRTINSSPALANGVVYVGSDDGSLYAVNAADGQKLWAFPTGGKIDSSPAYANGVVYVTSWDKKIYAIK
jgi:outer membrane protein assembly factor BamB